MNKLYSKEYSDFIHRLTILRDHLDLLAEWPEDRVYNWDEAVMFHANAKRFDLALELFQDELLDLNRLVLKHIKDNQEQDEEPVNVKIDSPFGSNK